MPRGVTEAVATELAAMVNRPVLLVSIALAAGTVYYTSAPDTLSWDTHPWVAVGVDIERFDQDGNGIASVELKFPGYSNPVVTTIVQGLHRGKAASAYLAFVDADGAVIADPELIIRGVCSGGSVRDDGCRTTITAGADSRYTRAPRRLISAQTGFNHLPPDGSVIEWKGEKYTLRRRTI